MYIYFQVSLNPVQIFKAGADEEKAETARLVRNFFNTYIYMYFNIENSEAFSEIFVLLYLLLMALKKLLAPR